MKRNNGAVIALLFIAIMVVLLIAQTFKAQNDIEGQTESKLLEKTTTCSSQKDICYHNDANVYHYLDVYLPDDEGPFPAIVYIHGGGWGRRLSKGF